MKRKLNTYNEEDYTQERAKYFTSSVLRTDNEFYKENDNIAQKVIRVKYVLNKKDERWDIFENNKVLLTLSAKRFTKKEKAFLNTASGVNYIIHEFKNGLDNISAFKRGLKDKIN